MPVQPPFSQNSVSGPMDAFQAPPGYEAALKPFMEARMQRLKSGGWGVHNNTFNPQGGYTQAFLDWDAADKAQHPFNFPGVSQVNNPLGPIAPNPSNQTTQPPSANPTPGTVTNPVSTQPSSVPQSTPDTNWFQNYMNRINYGFNFNYPNFANQSQDMGF